MTFSGVWEGGGSFGGRMPKSPPLAEVLHCHGLNTEGYIIKASNYGISGK